MASIFDVAKYILKQGGQMTKWKLQKLCFYSQAWSLAWTEQPIFPEDFEAWSNGPVCPELIQMLDGLYMCSEKDISTGSACALNDDQKETVDIIIQDYGQLPPYWLRDIIHNEDPWKLARTGFVDGERCSNVITKDSMGEYYGCL